MLILTKMIYQRSLCGLSSRFTDKMWCHTNILTFNVPVGFGSVCVSIISHSLSLALSLLFSPPQPLAEEGEKVDPTGFGHSHCSCLSSVHEGITLIDFPLSFLVKQMA